MVNLVLFSQYRSSNWFFSIRQVIGLLLVVWSFSSCNITRTVPDGRYLLYKNKLEFDDTKEVSRSKMESYIQQRPNDPRISLRIYNWLKGDTSRWLVRKAGKTPVLYNEKLTGQSIQNIKMEMANEGFLHAEVKALTDTSGKKIYVTYHVKGNEPYRIRDYKVSLNDNRIDTILTVRNRRERSELLPGTIFAMDKLETERTKVSQLLRNVGYYTSTESNLRYLADTIRRPRQVDLTMVLQDSLPPKLYYIRHIDVFSGYDPFAKVHFRMKDSIDYNGLHIFYDSTHFMRPSVLRKNLLMKSETIYSAQRDKQTYSHISTLGCVSRTDIQYKEVMVNDTSMLDCKVYLTPGNIHGMQMGIDGTNKAGNLGAAVNVSYSHYNLFNGGEQLTIKLRGAYEFVSSDTLLHNYYEVGAGLSLSFPQAHIPVFGQHLKSRYTTSSQYSISFDLQKRPEYTRDFFNLSWKQKLDNEKRTLSQTLSIIDINYVMMPWMSAEFENYLNQESNTLTRFSYENVFTTGIGYSFIYTNTNVGKFKRGLNTLRFSSEASGNILEGIFSLSNAKKSDDGQYTIFGNPFAQYVKGDVDFAQTFRLNPKNAIAMHGAIGVAFPYGNSTILPFEKRYYGGGPNNVRGWSTRYLGPGEYYKEGDESNPATHVGDIRLVLSAEYRYKWIKWLEFATFIDAGNIWTIRDYDNQPGGLFEWKTFYRQIAMGCGIGLRLDLSVLIIRVDGGKRIYDPARTQGDRWTFFEGFKGNSALYLAIGYPF